LHRPVPVLYHRYERLDYRLSSSSEHLSSSINPDLKRRKTEEHGRPANTAPTITTPRANLAQHNNNLPRDLESHKLEVGSMSTRKTSKPSSSRKPSPKLRSVAFSVATSTMSGRKKKATPSPVAGKVAWRSDSADGRCLQGLIRDGAVGGMKPAAIKAAYPQFRKYDASAFSANLRRYRDKAVVDLLRNPEGKSDTRF
jgi:hypothetical protein